MNESMEVIPKWEAVAPYILAVLANPASEEGRFLAEVEVTRMANRADRYVRLKAAVEAFLLDGDVEALRGHYNNIKEGK